MKRYYKINPRNFANEYTVYVTTPDNDAAFVALFPTAERITREQAIEAGIREPRRADRDQQQWFGGFADHYVSAAAMDRELCGDPATDSDLIHYAATATAEIIGETQQERER